MRYGLSEKGWINKEVFHGWFGKHFLKHAVTSRPLFLLHDGHSSHYDPETIRFTTENNIIICASPLTQHMKQPLDCSLFGPLKLTGARLFMISSINKLNFCRLFRKAWLQINHPREHFVADFGKLEFILSIGMQYLLLTLSC